MANINAAGNTLPIFAGLIQLAYVTNDMDRACAQFAERYGIPGFFRRETEINGRMSGQPAKVGLALAFANIGTLQIEFIQPLSGATALYADPLPHDGSFGLVLHHAAVRVTGDINDWRRARAALDSERRRVAFEADIGEIIAFAYCDERDGLGLYIEHIWYDENEWQRRDALIPRFPATR